MQDDTLLPGKSGLQENLTWQTLQDGNREANLFDQVQALKKVVHSLAQEVSVLKQLAMDSGTIDRARYRELRTERMIGDHSSLGIDPEKSYSLYPHTLADNEFLMEVLQATPEQLAEYSKRVHEARTMASLLELN